MASDPRDYKLDISSLNTGSPGQGRKSARRFISVFYACCQTYSRVYVNAEGTAYDARCPRCGRTMRFVVGTGGTDRRSFVVE